MGQLPAGPLAVGSGPLVAEHTPDVVVFALGANDLGFWNLSVPSVLELVEGWLAAARSVNPSLKFVLVEVLTHRDIYAPYNEALRGFVEQVATPESPVVVATAAEGYRSSAGFDDGGDTWDQLHPNAQGSQKIAAAVADALARLGIGQPYPRPLPAVEEGPTGIPDLALHPVAVGETGHASSVRLEWSAVDGASSVQVEHRVGDGVWMSDGERRDLLWGRDLLVEDLADCVTHEFRVRSVKVWTRASAKYASPVVQHRWGGVVTQAAGEKLEVRVVPLGAHGSGPVTSLEFDGGPRGVPDRPAVAPRAVARAFDSVEGVRTVRRARRVLRVAWADAVGETGYEVRVARGKGRWRLAARVQADVRRVRLAGLRPGVRHRIQVRAVGEGKRRGPWSSTLSVRTRR